MRAAVFGSVAWNLMIRVEKLPEGKPGTVAAASHHETVGGGWAGKALNLARLGLDVTLHAGLGDDEAGEKVRARLGGEPLQLETTGDPRGTARHVNLMDPHGGRIPYLIVIGSDDLPVDEAAVAASMARSDVIVVDLAPWTPRVLPLAEASGKPVWTDVHDYDGRSEWHQAFVEAGDVVFVSAQRLSDPREYLRSVVDAGASVGVCTMGAKGSIALDREGRWFEQPAVPNVEVVDANGLGDAFFSGTLFGVLSGDTLGEALRYGARASAMSLGSPELASDDLSPESVRAGPS